MNKISGFFFYLSYFALPTPFWVPYNLGEHNRIISFIIIINWLIGNIINYLYVVPDFFSNRGVDKIRYLGNSPIARPFFHIIALIFFQSCKWIEIPLEIEFCFLTTIMIHDG